MPKKRKDKKRDYYKENPSIPGAQPLLQPGTSSKYGACGVDHAPLLSQSDLMSERRTRLASVYDALDCMKPLVNGTGIKAEYAPRVTLFSNHIKAVGRGAEQSAKHFDGTLQHLDGFKMPSGHQFTESFNQMVDGMVAHLNDFFNDPASCHSDWFYLQGVSADALQALVDSAKADLHSSNAARHSFNR